MILSKPVARQWDGDERSGRVQLLFGDRMWLQIFFLLVDLRVMQFRLQFPRVTARVVMIGVFASFFLAPVLACSVGAKKNKRQ